MKDEEISSEEEAAVQAARDELAAGGKTIPLDVETEFAAYLEAEARLPPGGRDVREGGWAAANAREAIREEQW